MKKEPIAKKNMPHFIKVLCFDFLNKEVKPESSAKKNKTKTANSKDITTCII